MRAGWRIYVWPKDDDARRLAQLVIDEVKPIFGDVPSGILDGSHLGEVNSTNATALLLELGYHDHPEDALIIRTRSVEIGQAEGLAIARFYGKTISQPPAQEDPMTDDILREISAKLTAIYDTLTPGREGVKEAGATYLAITQPAAPLDLAAVTEAVARGVAAAHTTTTGV